MGIVWVKNKLLMITNIYEEIYILKFMLLKIFIKPILFFLNLYSLIKKFIFLKMVNFKHLGINPNINVGFISSPSNVWVGDNVYLGPNYTIDARGGFKIGSGTRIAAKLTVYTSNHNFRNAECLPYDNKNVIKPVNIGKNCWIGEGVMMNPGISLGDGVIVALGSVVTKSFPNYSIIGGNPAKLIKIRDDIENYKQLSKKNLNINNMGYMERINIKFENK